MDRMRLTLEAIIANSRWLIAPFLLGLIFTIAGLLYNFVLKLFNFFSRAPGSPTRPKSLLEA